MELLLAMEAKGREQLQQHHEIQQQHHMRWLSCQATQTGSLPAAIRLSYAGTPLEPAGHQELHHQQHMDQLEVQGQVRNKFPKSQSKRTSRLRANM